MYSSVEILCKLEGKIGLVSWQLLHNLHAIDILWFNLAVNFMYFLSCSLNLLGIFTSKKKLRSFERNPCFWDSSLMPWQSIIQLLWPCWKILLHFFCNKYGWKMKGNEHFNQLFHVFLVIFEALKGYQSKA